MDDDLRERTTELLQEAGRHLLRGSESLVTAIVALLGVAAALFELVAEWTAHILGRTISWAIETGIPMARSAGRTAAVMLVDVSAVTIQITSVAVVGLVGVSASIGRSLLEWLFGR